MATAAATNISTGLGILAKILELSPTVGPAIQIAQVLATDIKAAYDGGTDITPDQLKPGEDVTAQLMQEIEDDIKGA